MFHWCQDWLRCEAVGGNEHTWSELAQGALDSSPAFREEMVKTLLSADVVEVHAEEDLEEETAVRLLRAVALLEAGIEDGSDAQLQDRLMWRMKAALHKWVPVQGFRS